MNSLEENLKFRAVIVDETVLQEKMDPVMHPFLVLDGFGASSYTGGTAIYGAFLSDGEEARLSGDDVKRFATPEEVENAGATERILAEHSITVEQVTEDGH